MHNNQQGTVFLGCTQI